MPQILYLRLSQTPEQRRRVGARGGRAAARSRRARLQTAAALAPAGVSRREHPIESTAAAIAALDAQFPWLLGAQKRLPRTS